MGRHIPGVLEQQQGRQCGWNWVNQGTKAKRQSHKEREWCRAGVKRDHIGLDVTVRTLGETGSRWRVRAEERQNWTYMLTASLWGGTGKGRKQLRGNCNNPEER